ncbi:element excision factor XisH family protein [Nostoc sp.]|uniref:element excision factor XisH family protein n=1 Tax=Nostoc sp. TaxID=1180 RepID=UPI002FFD362D
MQALDIFHDVVKHALEKDGWLITNDPLFRWCRENSSGSISLFQVAQTDNNPLR